MKAPCPSIPGRLTRRRVTRIILGWTPVFILMSSSIATGQLVSGARKPAPASRNAALSGRVARLMEVETIRDRESLRNAFATEIDSTRHAAEQLIATGNRLERKAAQEIKERLDRQFSIAMDLQETEKIVGGEVADAGQFPYQVALVFVGYSNPRKGQYCGGSLIAPDWVVTAAHCLVTRWGTQMKAGDLVVFAGSNTLSTGGRLVPVLQVVPHESYNRASHENDIALLRLSVPTLGTPVKPMDQAAEGTFSASIGVGIISGWGTTTSGLKKGSDNLLYASVALLTNKQCNSQERYGGAITESMVCAGSLGADSCQGDSGGPLTVNTGQSTLLYGIVSWGKGCGQPNFPGVYTRVANYSPWIDRQTKPQTITQKLPSK